MPKIHDDKKKSLLEGKANDKGASKVKAGGPGVGFAQASQSLKPKPTPQRTTASQLAVPKLNTFKSCADPLAAAVAGAQAGASGAAQLSRALEALSEQLRDQLAETEYMQKGDLATRMTLSNEQKHALAEKAEADAAEIEAIVDLVGALSELVSKDPDAALLVDRAAEDLAEALRDTESLARTFGAEGFVLQGQKAASSAPPPKAAKEEMAKKPAAQVKKKPAPLPKPAGAAKAPAPKATKSKAKAA